MEQQHRRRGGAKRPAAAVRTLHELPEDVLHAIMGRLSGNEAVKLGSMHSALRSALVTLPSLQPTVMLDVSVIREGARTRSDQAAQHTRQRRSDSFGAFMAAHPGAAINAMTVQLALPAVVPLRVQKNAVFDIHWLPLRSLQLLRVMACWERGFYAQVLQCSCIRKVLLACPLLEQLTVELGHRGTYASGVASWAAVLVRAIQDAQRGNALASALRRLELRCRSCVTLDLMCGSESHVADAVPVPSCRLDVVLQAPVIVFSSFSLAYLGHYGRWTVDSMTLRATTFRCELSQMSAHIQASHMEQQFNNFLAHTDLQLVGGSLCADENLSQLTQGSAKAMMMMLLRSRFTQTSFT